MSNKSVLLLIIFAAAVLISGCISSDDNGTTVEKPSIGSDFIPDSSLPEGFTLMGIHETSVEIGEFTLNATEGAYRNDKCYENACYIQVIKNDNPEALIAQYKLLYKNANYDPFQEISFNGHKATQIMDYSITKGLQQPYYEIIWTNSGYIIIVGRSNDAQVALNLAKATGY